MLCLHGYHGTGAILRRQMAPLAAGIPPNIELVYPDAPSLSADDFGWWHDGFRGWERTRDWAVELLRTAPPIDGIFGPRSDSMLLAGRFADPLILEHPGGHVIPGDPAVTRPIAEFLDRFSPRQHASR